MGEEAFDEYELVSADGRTLVVRGGYSRESVWIGWCRSKSEQPEVLLEVDGLELRDALNGMVIGDRVPRKSLLRDARARARWYEGRLREVEAVLADVLTKAEVQP